MCQLARPERQAPAPIAQPQALAQLWQAGSHPRLLSTRFQMDKPKHTPQNSQHMKQRAQPPRHTMPQLRGRSRCCSAAAAPHSTGRPQPHVHATRQQHNWRCALRLDSKQQTATVKCYVGGRPAVQALLILSPLACHWLLAALATEQARCGLCCTRMYNTTLREQALSAHCTRQHTRRETPTEQGTTKRTHKCT
jgi:hypothetical protein